MPALPYHVYTWPEAVPDEDIEDGSNEQLNRITIDILLCGPTTDEQIRAKVTGPKQDVVSIEINMAKTFINPRRTAVRVADMAGAANGNLGRVINTAAGMSRVQAHKKELDAYKKATGGKIKWDIQLAEPVEKKLCRRDDYGAGNNCDGMTIATYQHENPIMQQAGQFIWICHLELAAVARPGVSDEMKSPSAIKTYHDYA